VIRGIGIDIVDVDDLRNQIENTSGYLEGVFTTEEIECCKSRPNPYECFAARFAAKEAFMKAVGTGWTDKIDFRGIMIESDSATIPTITLVQEIRDALPFKEAFRLYLSMSHLPTYACAVVVLDQ
jgi:holo-[acyl-carrier protein] synthase